MTLGERIRELRIKNKMSQEDLAERLGVSRQSVSKWELDNSQPDLARVKELGDIFKVSLDELVYGEAAPNPNPGPSQEPGEPSIPRRQLVFYGLPLGLNIGGLYIMNLKHRQLGFNMQVLALLIFFISLKSTREKDSQLFQLNLKYNLLIFIFQPILELGYWIWERIHSFIFNDKLKVHRIYRYGGDNEIRLFEKSLTGIIYQSNLLSNLGFLLIIGLLFYLGYRIVEKLIGKIFREEEA